MMRLFSAILALVITSSASAQQPQALPPARERALEAMLQEQVTFRTQCVTAMVGAQDESTKSREKIAELEKEIAALKGEKK